jgi:hypothetical protein
MEINAGVVTISYDEYQNLKDDSDMIMALRDAGVDNWDGYAYAKDLYYERKDNG